MLIGEKKKKDRKVLTGNCQTKYEWRRTNLKCPITDNEINFNL